LISECRPPGGPDKIHRLDSYRFDKNSSFISRVSMPPPLVLDYLKKLDSRSDYEPYLPGKREKHAMEKGFALLPELNREVLEKRLIGVYFIKNFTGNGLCEWVMDRDGRVFVFLVFNPSSLKKTISGLLTEKEKTCFINDDSSIRIDVDCGTKYPGFYYILLHESTHAVDYVLNITPYVDESYRRYAKKEKSETEFTEDYWRGYSASKAHFIFSNRVSFYHIGKPDLKISEAVAVYEDLARSPFVSLYGSMSWAEDLAEMVAFYHITSILKEPFGVYVFRKKEKIFAIYPMAGPSVIKRFPLLKKFYRPEEL